MNAPSPRLQAFDGLRGLLAFGVVLSHLAAMIYNPFEGNPQASPFIFSLWHLGAPAVDAFFVLSGWVVAQSYERYSSVGRYYLARFQRLYPVGLCGALLGLVLARALVTHLSPELTQNGFLHYLREPLSSTEVVGVLSLGLLSGYEANRINPPLWTLAVEVWASVLIPVFVLAARRWGWLSFVLSLLPALLLSFIWTGFIYMPMFLLGVLLAFFPPKLSRQFVPALMLLGFTVLFSRHLSGSNDPLYRWVTQFGAAALLLALAIQAPRLLLHPALQWLGSRSYALYATHFPILMLGVWLLGQQLGPVLAAALFIPLTLLVAELTQRSVGLLESRRAPLAKQQGVPHVRP